jgi:fructosamine-3-kinase
VYPYAEVQIHVYPHDEQPDRIVIHGELWRTVCAAPRNAGLEPAPPAGGSH